MRHPAGLVPAGCFYVCWVNPRMRRGAGAHGGGDDGAACSRSPSEGSFSGWRLRGFVRVPSRIHVRGGMLLLASAGTTTRLAQDPRPEVRSPAGGYGDLFVCPPESTYTARCWSNRLPGFCLCAAKLPATVFQKELRQAGSFRFSPTSPRTLPEATAHTDGDIL